MLAAELRTGSVDRGLGIHRVFRQVGGEQRQRDKRPIDVVGPESAGVRGVTPAVDVPHTRRVVCLYQRQAITHARVQRCA